MRRAVGFVLAGVLTAAVSCSGDKTVTTAPDSSRATSAPAEAAPSSEAPSPSPTPTRSSAAAVGETLNLTGNESSEALAVTVVKVVDPAAAENEYSTPAPGKRFVAVQFRLENTGSEVYSDAPSNGARLVDTEGQQFEATYQGTSVGPGFPGSVTIAPGDTGLGFIAFEVPANSATSKVQFTMNSGFSANTGQWDIPAA
ncbi:DUF4352 domain-containing protein [Streptomyces sp. NPDC057298]|uniref:DUF4352 domain-containing protein n=1 Tax=Streptomyces sp. NPDC057298 TaxID=3346091 RepID=UPI00363BA4CD